MIEYCCGNNHFPSITAITAAGRTAVEAAPQELVAVWMQSEMAPGPVCRVVMTTLDLIWGDHFSRDEPGIFAPIRETLLDRGDYFMHLADLMSYARAQEEVGKLYADPDAWTRKAIINVACSGRFSSDRTIAEYAAEIWNALPCPVE